MTWLAGYGFSATQPKPKRPAQPQAQSQNAWEKGKTRVSVVVACCPECGCRFLRIKYSKGERTVILECKECTHKWKDERCDIINKK